VDAQTRKKLVDQYKDGYRAVAEALVGATDEELNARPAPNKWTAREIVHHLADSEMTTPRRSW
jgi:DinB superfamily